MNLVYSSSSSSYMDCMVFFGDEFFFFFFCRSGVRLDQCSCIGTYVVGLVIFGRYFYGSTTCRMSTRRLPVILFVSRIRLYHVVCCAECLWWPEGAFTLYAYVSMSVISDSLIVFYSSYSSYRLRGLSANLAARGSVTGYAVDCYCPDISYFIPCQLAALQACVYLPPFRWLPVRCP